MTRSELNTIAAMTDEQIAPLTCVALTSLQAMLAEKDAAHVGKAQAITDATAPLTAQVATLQAQVNALGGTEAGIAAAKQKKIADVEKKKADALAQADAADVELAELAK